MEYLPCGADEAPTPRCFDKADAETYWDGWNAGEQWMIDEATWEQLCDVLDHKDAAPLVKHIGGEPLAFGVGFVQGVFETVRANRLLD